MGHLRKQIYIIFSILILFIISEISSDERIINKHVRNKRFAEMADDIRGPYCATRIDEQCCPGRNDQCTVPILDTICYCDVFCNETASDCCPDFWNVCHGIDPPPLTRACTKDGADFPPGHVIKENCNQCTCVFDSSFPDGYRWNCTQNVCLIQADRLRAINDSDIGWKSGNYSEFWGLTLDEGFRFKLGTNAPEPSVLRMRPMRITVSDDLPEQFDAREKWPDKIHPVRDQGNCGASWAFTTVATASDRLAIESNGILSEELSPQHLLSCNRARGQKGCNGGYVDRGWWFMRKKGIVSEECYPYTSGQSGQAEDCLLPDKHDQFLMPCTENNTFGRVLYTTPPYRIANDERQIMQEIYRHGPVQATMKVKEDFFMYKSGVYRHMDQLPDRLQEGDDQGYHSVRIIGWGVETNANGNKTKYWLCVNSWGSDWGESGIFRIERGGNVSNIEGFVLGVRGRLLFYIVPSIVKPPLTRGELPYIVSEISGTRGDYYDIYIQTTKGRKSG